MNEDEEQNLKTNSPSTTNVSPSEVQPSSHTPPTIKIYTSRDFMPKGLSRTQKIGIFLLCGVIVFILKLVLFDSALDPEETIPDALVKINDPGGKTSSPTRRIWQEHV